MSSKLLLIAVASLGVAACSTVNKNIGQEDPALGEVARYNAAMQIINPDPVYPPGAAQPGDNGEKGADAAKRYRTGSVKEVQTMQTTNSAAGGSGGMGSAMTPH